MEQLVLIEFLLTLIIVAIVIVSMSVGVLFKKKSIVGSCGGVGAALGEADYSCDICGGDESKCDATSN